MSIDITDGLPLEQTPEHYIIFGQVDTRNYGLHLHKREAPTPEERAVTVPVAYRQGVVDLSNLTGVRIYENREIVYTFYRFYVEQADANAYQTTLENLFMQEFDQRLDDSYEPYYHYTGKCAAVSVEDDYEYSRLIVEITFDLYPFKIGNYPEGNDLWDPFNFEIDVFQDVFFTLTGTVNAPGAMTINLYNVSQNTHIPNVEAHMAEQPPDVGAVPWSEAAQLKITKDGITHTMARNGENAFPNLRLKRGLNTMTATGIGTLKFTWYKELI